MVLFNATACAYLDNLQGDVIGLLDSTGSKVVSYTYDAWGKQIIKTGTLASTLGTIQPFRYRGYVYDEETGLYYLRNRYYNARECRFINADNQIAYSRTNCNANLFVYCSNTPVRCTDPDGQTTLDAALPALAGASLLDGPFPILDGICLFAAACLAVYDAVTVYQIASSAANSTRTKTLSDVKVKLKKSGYEYQLAYVGDSGALIRVGPKMDLAGAIAALGVTGSVNISVDAYKYNLGRSSDAQRQLEHLGSGNWGIYASSQEAAKALAVIFQGHKAPEVHSSGMYGHYHDGTHTFHIWYGGVLSY